MKFRVVITLLLFVLARCHEEGEFYEGSRLKFVRAIPRPPLHGHTSTQQLPPPPRSPLPDISTTVGSLCTSNLGWLPSAWSTYLFHSSTTITSAFHYCPTSSIGVSQFSFNPSTCTQGSLGLFPTVAF